MIQFSFRQNVFKSYVVKQIVLVLYTMRLCDCYQLNVSLNNFMVQSGCPVYKVCHNRKVLE